MKTLYRLVSLTLLISLTLTCGAAQVSAAGNDGIVTNAIAVGYVKATLSETYVNVPIQTIQVESLVSKVVEINNTSNVPILLRVKVEAFWGDPVADPAPSTDPIIPPTPAAPLPFISADANNPQLVLNLNSANDWKAVDTTTAGDNSATGYYYYIKATDNGTGVLMPNESTLVFLSSFKLDRLTGNLDLTDDGYIVLTLECVQAGGEIITDSTGIEALWGLTENEITDIGLSYAMPPPTSPPSAVTLALNLGVNEFTFNPVSSGTAYNTASSGLFPIFFGGSGILPMVPGEERSQPVNVENSLTTPTEIFFQILAANGRTDSAVTALLPYITIIVTKDGTEELFNDTADTAMGAMVSLGIFDPNDIKTLTVTATIATGLNNTGLANLIGLIDWKFVTVPSFMKVTIDPDNANKLKPLPGVVFALINTADGTKTYTVTGDSDGWITFVDDTTDEFIPPGSYTMTEAAPAGYYGQGPWAVTIAANYLYATTFNPPLTKHTADAGDPDDYDYVLNRLGVELPLTGGYDRFALYMMGIMLLIAGTGVWICRQNRTPRLRRR